ncbi:MAG: AAA family ATPase, partial [Paludibacteraceae bacterium]|nr:AAA family ATPase [Paludibacteraceae bacterium]
MSNYLNLLSAELLVSEQQAKNIPSQVGMFNVKTANQTLQEASSRPNPKALWNPFWYEGEVCCLFSDSNMGKSLYSVQIANEISKTQPVLLFDFELSDKQFQLRYTDENGCLFRFPNNLYRVEINPDLVKSENFELSLINNIEETAIKTGAKVLIIDNLTYLCIASEKGESASILMMSLMTLKRRYNLSILVLAHTPKRALSNPITQNDLAGSKKLFNFFDSCFAIGRSAKDSNLRYIKQIKVRYGNYTHDADNVIGCSIEKVNSFLQFVSIGVAEEREHLKEHDENEKEY